MDRFIQTHTGKRFFLENPSPDSIDILDIATALSNLCRFTGHTRVFYSVAEHSIRVAQELPDELKFLGLMHDATEAYLGDVSSPLKHLLPDYRRIEEIVWGVMAEKWGLPHSKDFPEELKRADLVLLATERRDIMTPTSDVWYNLPDPLPGEIYPLPPETARNEFLSLYYYYFFKRY